MMDLLAAAEGGGTQRIEVTSPTTMFTIQTQPPEARSRGLCFSMHTLQLVASTQNFSLSLQTCSVRTAGCCPRWEGAQFTTAVNPAARLFKAGLRFGRISTRSLDQDGFWG
ncbi:hypothetical protein J3458_013299 [Metarhizium acridum]|uniref:uncharacterized protein n=1 Tax=Metarhizium acridum TaxID=92637 RepID=UPI001C6BD3EE|nr:hypothetical protein J3458_013299 [Metarhizium acridum]